MKLSSAQPFQGGFILEKVMGPLSTGHLELRTRNPNDNPVVTFNYFQHPDDLKRCVRGIQTIERVVQSKAFARFKYADMSFEYLLNLTASTPVNLRPPRSGPGASLPPSAEEFCQHTVTTIWHYHGGCVVGRVVDGDYKVIGIYRFRVIDMSDSWLLSWYKSSSHGYDAWQVKTNHSCYHIYTTSIMFTFFFTNC